MDVFVLVGVGVGVASGSGDGVEGSGVGRACAEGREEGEGEGWWGWEERVEEMVWVGEVFRILRGLFGLNGGWDVYLHIWLEWSERSVEDVNRSIELEGVVVLQ